MPPALRALHFYSRPLWQASLPATRKQKCLAAKGSEAQIDSWRWGDSNPCPNTTPKSFLHAYSGINCRETTGTGQTNHFLSCIVLHNSHSLPLRHPVFFLSRRRSLVTGEPATRPEWLLNHRLSGHGILCIAIWVLNIQIYVLIIQRTTCLYFQRSTLSKPGTPMNWWTCKFNEFFPVKKPSATLVFGCHKTEGLCTFSFSMVKSE